MSQPTALQTTVARQTFSLSIEEGIQSTIKIDGATFIVPQQLTAWARYAFECWLNIRDTNSSYPSSNKPIIQIEHEGEIVRQLFITVNADYNYPRT
jgi:hypothetical protein